MKWQNFGSFHQHRDVSVVRQILSASLVLGLTAALPLPAAGAVKSADTAGPTSMGGNGSEGSTASASAPSAPSTDSAGADDHYLSLSQLAEEYGIQITLVAVTAAGGLVDVRLKVLDPEKARTLVGEPPTMPVLVPMGSDLKLMTPHRMMHAIRLEKGAVSYALYPNVRTAVKPGGRVSVAFDKVRVEPIVAR